MKSVQFAVVLLFVCGAQAARAQEPSVAPACQYHEEPLPIAAGDAAPASTKITLLGIDPPAGGDVRRTTVIGIDVEFSIAKFEPDRHFLLTRFPTTYRHTTSRLANVDYPDLKSPAGKVHLCVPLVEVYDTASVHWPLSLVVSINKKGDAKGSSTVLADTPSVQFNALDIPEGALERQAAEPPVEYQDALGKSFAYVEARAVLYKVCIKNYPDMQAPFTKAYRRWEARHSADIKLLNERQYESVKLAVSNNAQQAAQVFDGMRDAITKRYEQMDEQRRRGRCQSSLQDLLDPEDLTDDAIGDELVIVRAWHPPENSK